MQRSATSSLIEGPPRATGNIRRLRVVIGGLGTVRWQLPRLKPGDCQWREKENFRGARLGAAWRAVAPASGE